MNGKLPLFAALALLPAMVGPLPAAARSMAVPLCNGGTATVVLPMGGDAPPGAPQGPCCAKGCHSGPSRKRVDKSQ